MINAERTCFKPEAAVGDTVLVNNKKYKVIDSTNLIKVSNMERLIVGIVKGAMIIGICYGLVLLLQK